MFKPASGRLLVLPEEEKVTKGGIHLPDTAKDKGKVLCGFVTEVGADYIHESGQWVKSQFCRAAKVWFPAYAGHEVERDGKKYRVLAETDVLAWEGK